MNETTQQEKTTQLGSRNETAQLVSRTETTQLRNETSRRPPTTTCNRLHRFYSRIGFSTYSPQRVLRRLDGSRPLETRSAGFCSEET
ncbi:hypothetical protein TNCV_2022331 [Trichonephila clavipes]|nr:hypothetical protein TNCV_2022331 [Trichonephila clavipes]